MGRNPANVSLSRVCLSSLPAAEAKENHRRTMLSIGISQNSRCADFGAPWSSLRLSQTLTRKNEVSRARGDELRRVQTIQRRWSTVRTPCSASLSTFLSKCHSGATADAQNSDGEREGGEGGDEVRVKHDRCFRAARSLWSQPPAVSSSLLRPGSGKTMWASSAKVRPSQ